MKRKKRNQKMKNNVITITYNIVNIYIVTILTNNYIEYIYIYMNYYCCCSSSSSSNSITCAVFLGGLFNF